jgi:hypothetical protein
MIRFTLIHPEACEEYLGLVPFFVSQVDPRPCKEQIDENYQHGGGWRSIDGFKIEHELSPLEKVTSPYVMAQRLTLKYPGDDPLTPVAVAQNHNETLVLYDGAFLAIFQPDYSFEIARLD